MGLESPRIFMLKKNLEMSQKENFHREMAKIVLPKNKNNLHMGNLQKSMCPIPSNQQEVSLLWFDRSILGPFPRLVLETTPLSYNIHSY